MNSDVQFEHRREHHALSAVVIGVAILVSSVCLMAIAIGLIIPIVNRAVSQPADPTATKLSLLALALRNYHDEYGAFPPAFVADAAGKPLYSGRVLLLPFLGEQLLFNKFDLAAAWDSPQNLELSKRTVAAFQNPRNFMPRAGETDFVFVTGNGTLFESDRSRSLANVTDGMSATLTFVEIKASGINWAEPRDFDASKATPLPVGENPAGTFASFADGAVRLVPRAMAPESIRAMATRDGKEPKIDF